MHTDRVTHLLAAASKHSHPSLNPTDAIAIVSAAVAVVALYFTRQQVQQAQLQTRLQQQIRQDQAQPYVWADIRQSPQSMHLMMLIVRNEGPTVARNVRVTFDPPLPRTIGASDDRDTYTIIGMPPGRQMGWHLSTSPDWIHSNLPKRFKVTVNADGPHGPITATSYELDVDEYRRASATPPGTLHGITEKIDDIVTVLKERLELPD